MLQFQDGLDAVEPRHADWICQRLAWHKILPLAAALNDPSKPKCPQLESVFQHVLLKNTVRAKHYEIQVRAMFHMLRQAAIDFTPYKGPFWSQPIYPDYAWRHIGDIDLMLDIAHARKASALLQAAGWVPDIVGVSEEEDFRLRGELTLFPDPKATRRLKKRILVQDHGGSGFQTAGMLAYGEDLKPGSNKDLGPKYLFEMASNSRFPVQLHWDPLPSPRFVKKKYMPAELFKTGAEPTTWQGIDFLIPRPEIQFYYHLLHATCQHQFLRFAHLLTPIHFLLKFPNLDWAFFQDMISARQAHTPVYYGLKFISHFYALPEPAQKIMSTIRPRFKSRLAAAALHPNAIMNATRQCGRHRRELFRVAMSW